MWQCCRKGDETVGLFVGRKLTRAGRPLRVSMARRIPPMGQKKIAPAYRRVHQLLQSDERVLQCRLATSTPPKSSTGSDSNGFQPGGELVGFRSATVEYGARFAKNVSICGLEENPDAVFDARYHPWSRSL